MKLNIAKYQQYGQRNVVMNVFIDNSRNIEQIAHDTLLEAIIK